MRQYAFRVGKLSHFLQPLKLQCFLLVLDKYLAAQSKNEGEPHRPKELQRSLTFFNAKTSPNGGIQPHRLRSSTIVMRNLASPDRLGKFHESRISNHLVLSWPDQQDLSINHPHLGEVHLQACVLHAQSRQATQLQCLFNRLILVTFLPTSQIGISGKTPPWCSSDATLTSVFRNQQYSHIFCLQRPTMWTV